MNSELENNIIVPEEEIEVIGYGDDISIAEDPEVVTGVTGIDGEDVFVMEIGDEGMFDDIDGFETIDASDDPVF